jgi:hypothetical protein
MDKEEFDLRLELERCKIQSEQNKKDVDELGNSLRAKNAAIESELDKLNNVSIRVHAYIAAIVTLLLAIAWLLEHKGVIQ